MSLFDMTVTSNAESTDNNSVYFITLNAAAIELQVKQLSNWKSYIPLSSPFSTAFPGFLLLK